MLKKVLVHHYNQVSHLMKKSMLVKNKDNQMYITLSTSIDINMRMVTLLSNYKTQTENGHPPVFRFARFVF